MKNPLISIITVTYNAEKFVESTLLSIASQTYPHIELIIVDGLSTDSTLELINRFKIENTKIISEKDRGLYDAMNKGIKMASGDLINFMNAGDTFYNADTLSFLFNDYYNEDFVYGDTILVDDFGNTSPYHKSKPNVQNFSYKSFINGMVICHQSMFVKKDKASYFNFEEYKIACDIDWCIRTLKNCTTFKDGNIIVSKFLDGGVSQNNRWKAVRERFWISVQHFGWLDTIHQNIWMFFQYHKSKLSH